LKQFGSVVKNKGGTIKQSHQNFCNFLAALQSNVNLWHKLLQGLNVCGFDFIGRLGALAGQPKIIPPLALAELSLTIHGQPTIPRQLLNPMAAHQNLGVYLTTDGI